MVSDERFMKTIIYGPGNYCVNKLLVSIFLIKSRFLRSPFTMNLSRNNNKIRYDTSVVHWSSLFTLVWYQEQKSYMQKSERWF